MATAGKLDGPRVAPRSGRARSLVVLLHGYGANGDDLISLADLWADKLPDTAFASPHAPERLPQAGVGGHQWFPLTMRDPGEYWRGVQAATPALEDCLTAELARYRLGPERLALVGFSQGTMMALHDGPRRAIPPAAIVGYSGVIAGPEHLGSGIKGRPPIQLIHGEQDDLIPVEAMMLTREALAAQGFPVEWHVRPGIGHGIDAEGLRLAGAFLAEKLR